MSDWTKGPAEKLNIALDWSPRLATGDAPSGTPTIDVSPSGLTVTYDSTEGDLTWLRVEGGTAVTAYAITLTTGTTGGETLTSKKTVVVQ